MSTKSSSGSSSATDLTSSCLARTRLKPCHKTISTTTVNVPIRSAQSRINCGGDGGCYQPRTDARSSGLQTDQSEDKVLRIVGNDASNSDMNFTDTSDSTLKAGDSSSCPCESKTRSSCVSLDTLGFYDDDWNGNYEVLYDWIDRMDFVKNQKNVHRDFSDGVLMAELLKKLWPKMVDLHNYSPANSFTNKLANWTTLNSKVLKKMKLGQSQKTLEDLARAEPDVLEQLLGKIKQKYDNSKLKLIPPPSVPFRRPPRNQGRNHSKSQARTLSIQSAIRAGDYRP
ncbi:hypothetical protein M8J76_007342 [Diaphorina citri]|nr:hypothetical protein M8J76_007342 [Diaphorina citri]